jgi:hypothetical protein
VVLPLRKGTKSKGCRACGASIAVELPNGPTIRVARSARPARMRCFTSSSCRRCSVVSCCMPGRCHRPARRPCERHVGPHVASAARQLSRPPADRGSPLVPRMVTGPRRRMPAWPALRLRSMLDRSTDAALSVPPFAASHPGGRGRRSRAGAPSWPRSAEALRGRHQMSARPGWRGGSGAAPRR